MCSCWNVCGSRSTCRQTYVPMHCQKWSDQVLHKHQRQNHQSTNFSIPVGGVCCGGFPAASPNPLSQKCLYLLRTNSNTVLAHPPPTACETLSETLLESLSDKPSEPLPTTVSAATLLDTLSLILFNALSLTLSDFLSETLSDTLCETLSDRPSETLSRNTLWHAFQVILFTFFWLIWCRCIDRSFVVLTTVRQIVIILYLLHSSSLPMSILIQRFTHSLNVNQL